MEGEININKEELTSQNVLIHLDKMLDQVLLSALNNDFEFRVSPDVYRLIVKAYSDIHPHVQMPMNFKGYRIKCYNIPDENIILKDKQDVSIDTDEDLHEEVLIECERLGYTYISHKKVDELVEIHFENKAGKGIYNIPYKDFIIKKLERQFE